MQQRLLIVALSFGAAIASASVEVQSAEGFVCGPDRVVYVEVHELEEKKRTDPCIAAFFGLKVETPAVPTPVAAPAAEPASMPQPASGRPGVQRPVVQPARKELPPAKPAVKATVSLKPGEVPERATRTRNAEQAALVLPPATAPGTDYRKVRVINAQSAETAWFHHVR